MSEFYDFSDVKDLREFIADVLDGYVPTQLNDFPKTTVMEAFKSFRFKERCFGEITGNGLYNECTWITNLELNVVLKDAISELLEGNNSLTKEETEILSDSLRDLEEAGCWEILDCYANGSLDSRLYLDGENQLLEKQLDTLRIVNEKTDAIRDFFDSLNCEVNGLDLIEESIEKDDFEGRCQ